MSSLASTARERIRFVVALFSKTADRFDDIEGFRLGAAFSYYATFAIFPLVLLSVTAIGFVIGDDGPARDRIVGAMGGADPSVRTVIDQTLTTMQESHGATTSAAVGIVSLLFSASGAFVELDSSLNKIWKVTPRTANGILGRVVLFLHERISGFVCVFGIGMLMLASLVASSTLSFLARGAHEYRLTQALLQTAELATSIALLSLGLAAAFHFVPRSRPAFRHVLPGAVLTTALLSVLKAVFALYLSHLTSYSAYGIVGGVLALATWIYLSSQIIFLGATLTQVHCEMTSTVE